jgi:hypothetical protein
MAADALAAGNAENAKYPPIAARHKERAARIIPPLKQLFLAERVTHHSVP